MKKQVLSQRRRHETATGSKVDYVSKSDEEGMRGNNRTESHVYESIRRKVTEQSGTEISDCNSKNENLTIVSIVLILEKIQDRTGSETVNELINLLNDKNFNLDLFHSMVKNREDCRRISDKYMSEHVRQ